LRKADNSGTQIGKNGARKAQKGTAG
jgi:hypothetical protein